jgi:hypothetical protein
MATGVLLRIAGFSRQTLWWIPPLMVRFDVRKTLQRRVVCLDNFVHRLRLGVREPRGPARRPSKTRGVAHCYGPC